MKTIFLLGSTGSIGRNTLDVVRQHPEEFRVGAIVTNQQTSLFAEQISEFKPEFAVVFNQNACSEFVKSYGNSAATILCGQAGIQQALDGTGYDIFVNAFVGFAGLQPTVSAIRNNLPIALANKETLVVAGKLVTDELRKNGVRLYPIDSEHSAIWQCITGEECNPIRRIILTASGGPFRSMTKEQLSSVTPEKALQHPNWTMGAKITVDSATLMNKGLEVIEAFWLYHVGVNQIEVVIHPQSIIHSMVEFEDNSIKAQLGIPDMRIPIQYALSYPKRYPLNVMQMDFQKYNSLTFEAPDVTKFPCLSLAYSVLEQGKSYPVVLNAANEIAVESFLNHRIGFTTIAEIIRHALDDHSPVELESFGQLEEIDHLVRLEVKKRITSKQNG